MTSLANVLLFSNGRSSPERSDGLPYPVYGSNGVIGFTNETNAEAGTIVIGRVGSYCGSLYFSKTKCWVTDNAIKANAVDDNDARFLFFLLQTLDLNHWRAGSGQPLLNQTILGAIPALVPSPDEQRAIAHILGALDDKVELNRRMNETLEAIARAIFKSWFVDFDPVCAKASGESPESICRRLGLTPELLALFPDRFQESELGQIPEGWEIKTVGDVIERLPVGRKYEQKTVKRVGNIPVLDQGRSGVIGYHDEEPGVIATSDNPIAVFANHTCHMRLVNFPFSAIQNVLPFTGRDVDTIWVYYAAYGIQPFIEYKGHWPDFVIHELTVPDVKLSAEFARQVHGLLKLLWSRENETHTLIAARDVLLPQLLSGKLRVPFEANG